MTETKQEIAAQVAKTYLEITMEEGRVQRALGDAAHNWVQRGEQAFTLGTVRGLSDELRDVRVYVQAMQELVGDMDDDTVGVKAFTRRADVLKKQFKEYIEGVR